MRHESSSGRRAVTMRGASMVEVLVSVVVLSVGILGNTALYFATMQAKTQVYSRSQAATLAADMAERIRSNPLARDSYAVQASTDVEFAPDCATTCTPDEIAVADIYEWSQAVKSTLHGEATRRIDVDSSTLPSTYTITLTWRPSRSGGAPQQYSLVARI